MKKIALPVFFAAAIVAFAWYVGAKDSPIDPPWKKPPHKPVILSDGSITMNVSTDNPNVLQGSDGAVALQIDLQAVDAAVKNRKPLNIALVIDRSGSMADRGKLEYARRAAMELIDRLGKNDRVSVIVYDDNAAVLVPSTNVANPEAIKRKIAGITDGGSTNLSGGLILGHKEVARHLDREAVNQVIILSDGLANRGITGAEELNRLVSGWSEAGVRVTSMGLGADFNEDLMMGIANASRGHYYFIESPAQLAGIYEKELAALMRTVSNDVTITLELADGVKFDKVFGYNARVAGSKVKIDLGAFNSGQRRVVMARLLVPTEKIGAAKLAKVKLNYKDLLQNGKNIVSVARMGVNAIADLARMEETRNKKVEGFGYWFNNEEDASEAIDDLQNGRKDDAIGWYERKVREIRERNAEIDSPALEAQADAYEKELEELREMDDAAGEDGKNFVKSKKESQRLRSLGYMQ